MLTLEEIAWLTSLSTRTLRNYIRDGFLQGDKSSGKWLFTWEQYRAFTNHPAIAPALRMKKTAIITEFLETVPDNGNRMCVMLDVNEHLRETMKLLTGTVNKTEIEGYELSYSIDRPNNGVVRFIIRGGESNVLAILAAYQEAKKAWA